MSKFKFVIGYPDSWLRADDYKWSSLEECALSTWSHSRETSRYILYVYKGDVLIGSKDVSHVIPLFEFRNDWAVVAAQQTAFEYLRAVVEQIKKGEDTQALTL